MFPSATSLADDILDLRSSSGPGSARLDLGRPRDVKIPGLLQYSGSKGRVTIKRHNLSPKHTIEAGAGDNVAPHQYHRYRDWDRCPGEGQGPTTHLTTQAEVSGLKTCSSDPVHLPELSQQ